MFIVFYRWTHNEHLHSFLRFGAEDVDGGFVTKLVPLPPAEPSKVFDENGKQDNAKASSATVACSGVETLFFMYEDDEYAGLPTLPS
ncbi:unnamed protein product [Dibothriocephalus latus]|uniref:Uncharacterized protein n=1 Tax=Dibothriocephalus latus TaxID=60516 RepID=A0A3P7NX25_DIBLA|nr:unnamed protein product [Dibothriocephalus latus]